MCGKIELSLIVPCYNEENNVLLFFNEVNKVFSDSNLSYEFIFIDDGSKDKTYQKLKEIYENNKEYNIQVLSFSRNFGKEAAMYAGLSKVRGEKACIIDADLQQRPEVVLEMLNIMKENPDVDCVTAYQETRKENKLISNIKSCFYKTINKISEVDFKNGASDFRLIKSNVVNAILAMSEYHRFSKGIFSWIGFNTVYVPYKAEERLIGKSKWSLKKLIKYAVEGIFSFSSFPLKLSTITGIFSSIASLLYLIVVIIQKCAFGIDVPGYATIVVLLLFLGGMQLFCLGIIGEYISKIFIQSKNRPIYILKEHLK